MPEVFPGDSLSAESLRSIHSHRCDDAGQRLTLRMTIQVIHEAHAHDLDGHPTSFVLHLRYISKAPAFDFHRAFRTVRDVHRLWDHSMSAARFAKLIEQL
jgi:hypothetical protein